MLRVEDLHVRYGTTHAVRGVSIDVTAGEAVCLIGPNGAGKTSLLAGVGGTVRSQGRVTFDGQDVTSLDASARARLGLILVPEGRHVFPGLTVHENIQVGCAAAKGRRRTFDVSDAYSLFPALDPLRERRGGLLSGGEQQMLALARALMGAPRLLMVDEPSLGLSPAVCKVVYRALAQIQGEVPVLLVEQNTTDALALCQRGHVIVNGREVMRGSSDELADRDALLESYLGMRDMSRGDEPS